MTKSTTNGDNGENGESKENKMEVENPFKRSGTSPQKAASNSDKEDSSQSSGKVKGLRRKLKIIEGTIRNLNDFASTKTNIHTEIKKMIAKAMIEMAGAMKELERTEVELEKTEVQAVATPASRFSMANTVTETPKSTTPAAAWKFVEKRKRSFEEAKERAPKARKRDGQEATPRVALQTQQKSLRTSKKTTIKPRSDAIVVELAGGATYAEILRRVKQDPNLKQLGDEVVRVKRNQKGQMMFELKKEEGVKRDSLKEAVTQALGDTATVTVRTHEINVVCRDMDEVTTKEEVLEALKKQLEISSLPESAIRSLREAYGGTQTAVISLPFELAKKILAAGKVKIGWTICRVREATRPKSCFRCFDYGHLAKDCKGEDRSKRCRKCGEEGHIARNCAKDPSCMICSTKNKKAPHITGSSRCPKSRSSTKQDKT